MTEKVMCRDWPDRPGCLGEIDLRYTMNFDDIGEEPIYWCTKCGMAAHAMHELINTAFEERGPEFLKTFGEAIDAEKAKEH